jgi:hypothetical protein
LLLNTYFHFSLSSKSWALGYLHSNVPGHGHVRQHIDVIKAQMKEDILVLCDMRFEPKKNSIIEHKLRQGGEKNKYLMVGVLPVFSNFVG